MLVNMLKLIGEYVVEDKTEIEILVDEQKEYKSKNILGISVDPSINNIEAARIYHEEYDDDKRYLYLRGTVGSGGSSLSPTMNISLQKVSKPKLPKSMIGKEKINEWKLFLSGTESENFRTLMKSAINIQQNIINTTKKDAFIALPDDSITKKLYQWIENHLDDLANEIFLYLYQEFMEITNSKLKISKDVPNSIFFSIRQNDNDQYPGEIDEIKQLYVALSRDAIPKRDITMACYTCSKQTAELLKPNIGIFNLNMQGFVLGFLDEKNSYQYSVCSDCNSLIKKGLDYVFTNLKFYAYKTRKGTFGGDNQLIFHYLIPIITDPQLLKKSVLNIAKSKKEIGAYKKASMRKQLKNLNNQLKRVNRSRKNKLKSTIKKLEKNIERESSEIGERTDILELLYNLSALEVSYLDIYFYETDAKQNPTTKEIIGFFLITNTAVSRINNATNILLKQGKHFEFFKLRELIPEKLFLSIMNALYLGTNLDKQEFMRNSNDVISESFQAKLLKIEKQNLKSHRFLLRNFKLSHEFLQLTHVFSN